MCINWWHDHSMLRLGEGFIVDMREETARCIWKEYRTEKAEGWTWPTDGMWPGEEQEQVERGDEWEKTRESVGKRPRQSIVEVKGCEDGEKLGVGWGKGKLLHWGKSRMYVVWGGGKTCEELGCLQGLWEVIAMTLRELGDQHLHWYAN